MQQYNRDTDADVATAEPPHMAVRLMIRLILIPVNLYQLLISPLLGSNCRHLPTCSDYIKDALHAHGLLRGSYYAVKRILRCHPGVAPSFDPVPPVSQTMRPTKNVKG
ncbi:membrane protein insertion efficiency factor YidD [Candidatus Puniceispirillum marinum]|uniref:membrane protein insertion efficiency factor YidD n=1 Tax=Candidatus Puniceispirillum marinum TaxID=767892 RepID=UPI0002F786D3|nr:membrane protein insertion efficiency factor YidD [Candidatus Puniceispirillum marinum]